MSAFFGERKKTILANYIVMAIVGILMFFLAFMYVLPNDVFTSALFFDGLGLQPVFSETAPMFDSGGVWERMPDVSLEAFVFAIALVLIQIFSGYQAAMEGKYTNKSSNMASLLVNWFRGKESIGRGNLNWHKVGWLALYWIVAIFDTLTDSFYRSYYGNLAFGFVIISLAVSFFFYSMASEWMIIVGAKTAVNYGTLAVKSGLGTLGQPSMPSYPQRKNQPKQRKSNQQKNQQPVRKDISRDMARFLQE